MAVNETQFKQEMRKDARAADVFVVSNSPEFNRGIPDLMLKHETFVPVFIELKWFRTPPRGQVCGLTALQAKWIRDYRNVGGKAELLIGWQSGPVEWSCGLHYQADENSKVHLSRTFVRHRGDAWPIESIVQEIAWK